MMGPSLDTLLTLAEVAIALAGFAAIVVIFKRAADGKWRRRDADQFHGMVVHAIFAVAFCLLPSFLNLIIQDVVTTLHAACAVLGVQIITHAFGVMRLASTGWAAKIALGFGVLVGLIQFAAFSDWGVLRELEIYILGIMWHIIQAGLLFVMLVWIPTDDIASDDRN